MPQELTGEKISGGTLIPNGQDVDLNLFHSD